MLGLAKSAITDMTNKSIRVDELLAQDDAGHLRRLHDRLLEIGLKTKISPNSKTLLFEATDNEGKKHGLAAMRSGYVSVFSFPKAFWSSRKTMLDQALSRIGARHFIETQDAVSESQYSVRQVRVSDDTARELMAVVNSLLACHNLALKE